MALSPEQILTNEKCLAHAGRLSLRPFVLQDFRTAKNGLIHWIAIAFRQAARVCSFPAPQVSASPKVGCLPFIEATVEPSALRNAILRRVDAHEATGSSAYLEDATIATELGATVGEIQRQLLILEDERKVDLAKSFGPRYGVRLTPKGLKALETPE